MPHRMRFACILVVLSASLFALATLALAQTPEKPVRSVPDPGVITTRQGITPAGVQSVFNGRVYGVAFGVSSETVYVLGIGSGGAAVFELNWRTNQVVCLIHAKVSPGMQGITIDPATAQPMLSGLGPVTADEKSQSVQVVSISGDTARVLVGHLGTDQVGGLVVAGEKNPSGQRYAVVALTFNNAIAVVDLVARKLKGTVKVGIAPFGAAINKSSSVAYVSDWGGRVPGPKDRTSPTGSEKDADNVVVDARGIASSGTVTRVDLLSMKATTSIPVGLHPNALFWDESRARLYVANNNSDSVSVINTVTNTVAQTISIQPFDRKSPGVAPNGVAVSPDGKTLYAACGGINAVAVVRAADGRIEGLIPTGWYPNHIQISSDAKYLAVSTLLGVGSGWNLENLKKMAKAVGLDVEVGPTHRYVHAYRGTVHVIPIPDAAQLAGYSTAVAENNHLRLRSARLARAESAPLSNPKPFPVPARAGDPSPIDHVVYIIKENRTFDQFFGDFSQANSDRSLAVYGRDVTPNHHRLAEQFVILDNFYATGGNSGDGHQWVTQGAETDYTYWPGYGGRSYPKAGDDPLAYASSGFIWDDALGRKKTVEVFGEFAGNLKDWKITDRAKFLDQWKNGDNFADTFHTVTPIAPLNKIVAKDFPAYGLQVPDVVRARIFLRHVDQWEKDGKMPNLAIIHLPSDHTIGTYPGTSTTKACMADNDLALGQIVEGLSRSRFWKSMAIFVVEDDAQDGIDHVDGHRTVALVISPYVRKGSIDSTFYSQPSMLKTIELILGLPTLSLFDLIATDMRNTFQATPDFASYTSERPQQSIFDLNPPASALKGAAREAALASLKMNFSVPDAAPTEILNRILWHDAKGWDRPYPQVSHAVFAPYSAGEPDTR
ncbi:MAG: bifunctional YncE family protein/alkaline phosphatase family protein [Candidatus Acidiferrales bacterium]